MEGQKKQLSQAEVYAKSVLALMRKCPDDCNLYDSLVSQIGNNPLIVFSGVGGGSMKIAIDYLKELQGIHQPHCKIQAQHKFFS